MNDSARAVLDTPLGSFVVTASERAVTSARWIDEPGPPAAEGATTVLTEALHELEEYFAGERRAFDVPVDLTHVGSFQRQVLQATVSIPYGQTRAYGDIATELGDRERMRAVGGALKFNPVAVIVPCHRVIAADGSLTGYGGAPGAGGRLDIKRALLEIEQGTLQQRLW